MTHDADHDPEFEAFLRRRSPLHRRLSQIDHAEPSSELDRVILDRARDAIETPAPEPMYHKSRWAMPLGLAATILIAFTVVLNVDHRRTAAPHEVAKNASARLAEAPANAPVPRLTARARNDASGAGAAEADIAEAAEERAFVPPPAALASDASTPQRQQAEEAKRVAKAEAAPAEAAANAAGADRRVIAASAEPSAERPAIVARAFRESRADAASEEVSVPQASDSAAQIASRRETTLASGRSLLGPISGATSAAHTVPPAALPASAAKAALPAAPAPAADPHASPETWLAQINRLRSEGQNEEADREMAAFRRAYPTHPGYSLAQPPTR